MKCPKCGYSYSNIVDCRTVGIATKRRHVCANCGHRYTGYELSADDYHLLMKERETRNKQFAMLKNIMEECFSA